MNEFGLYGVELNFSIGTPISEFLSFFKTFQNFRIFWKHFKISDFFENKSSGELNFVIMTNGVSPLFSFKPWIVSISRKCLSQMGMVLGQEIWVLYFGTRNLVLSISEAFASVSTHSQMAIHASNVMVQQIHTNRSLGKRERASTNCSIPDRDWSIREQISTFANLPDSSKL